MLNTLVKYSECVGSLWGKGWEAVPQQKREHEPVASDKQLRHVLASWSAASFIHSFIHLFVCSF